MSLRSPPRGRSATRDPHLSYALQWYVFALLGFIGLAWAANQERKGLAEASAAGGSTKPAPREPKRPKREKRDEDADVEDGILDRR